MTLDQRIQDLATRAAQSDKALADAIASLSPLRAPSVATLPTSPLPFQLIAWKPPAAAESDREIYYWDPARSKWLSLSTRDCIVSANSSSSNLNIGVSLMDVAATTGALIPWTATVTRWTSLTTFNETAVLQIYENGATIGTQLFSNQTKVDTPNLDINIAANAILHARIVSTSTGTFTRLVSSIEYRRRAT